jgi:hypothetical protein
MSEFMLLDAKAPATLGAVVEAVTRLSTLSETTILERVSAGKIKELFPFTPSSDLELPSDTVAEEDLVQASALPLDRRQRAALIQSSMPATRTEPRRAADGSMGRKRARSLGRK